MAALAILVPMAAASGAQSPPREGPSYDFDQAPARLAARVEFADAAIGHSVEGKGNPLSPLDGVGQRRSGDEIKAWILTPAEMAKKHGTTRKPAMLPYPESSEDELHDLVAYLVSLERN